MTKKRKRTATSHDCALCRAACCRYVALEIDTPSCKRDYDHIRWYLMHSNVYVFQGHDKGWYMEMETDCDNLGDDGLCQRYAERPLICREHGLEGEECVFFEEHGEPHKHRFSKAEEFEAWLDERGRKWRRKPKGEKSKKKAEKKKKKKGS